MRTLNVYIKKDLWPALLWLAQKWGVSPTTAARLIVEDALRSRSPIQEWDENILMPVTMRKHGRGEGEGQRSPE